jgi:ribonuclease HII
MNYPNLEYENKLRTKGIKLIGGVDEAGRGAWAGPVVAGSVILPEDIDIPDLKDSKLLTPKKRDYLYDVIIEKAISWSVGVVGADIIDMYGISEANQEAVNKAIAGLKIVPEFLLIDFLPKKDVQIINNLPHYLIIKGDKKVVSIAAASVIAKVTRDRIMNDYEEIFLDYGFASHKGYGTKKHREAIFSSGLCSIHRRSYRPMSEIT